MRNEKLIVLVLIICLVFCGLALAGGVPDPNLYPDLNGDEIINFADFAMMANNWQKTGVGLTGDFDNNQKVDYNDLFILAYRWLEGPPPLTVFEKLKAALAASDVNKAVSYFADSVSYEYSVIFEELRPVLPTMATGMGNLLLISSEGNIVRYEMLHDEGGGVIASFPVYFCKGADGSWKIYCF